MRSRGDLEFRGGFVDFEDLGGTLAEGGRMILQGGVETPEEAMVLVEHLMPTPLIVRPV